MRMPAPRRASAPPRVWAFVAVVAAAAALLWADAVGSRSVISSEGRLSWLLVALGFAGTDLIEVHFEFRQQTLMLTLGEIPLLVGIVFCTPGELLAARLLSAAVTNVWRQSPAKYVFNLAMYALAAAVALHAYGAVLRGASVVSPRGWLAAMAAVVAADATSHATVLTVIGLATGRFERGAAATVLRASPVVAVTNLSLGLLAVSVLWVDLWAGWLLVVPCAVFAFGYRAHRTLRRRYANLELLQRFTHTLAAALSANEVVEAMLAEACALLRADVAELSVVVPGGLQRSTVAGRAPLAVEVVPDCALHGMTRQAGRALLLANGHLDVDRRAALDIRGFRDAIVAPLAADLGDSVLLVADRLGEVTTFDRDDLKLFETLVGAASMALRNGQLLEQLRNEAAAKHHQALHDALTGLPNRSLFAKRVADALERRDASHAVAVLLMDLDEFKEVNDTLGHHTGDMLLRETGVRLAGALGARGLVARLGGDEFAIVIPDAADASDARAVGAALRTALEQPIVVDEFTLEVRTSVGIAIAPVHGEDAATLLQRADVAMYRAKADRSGVQLYAPEHDHYSPRRLGLVAELRAAIDSHALQVFFQPQADLRTGAVHAVEALVRWNHPRHGFVPPDEFIPIAEHSGLIRSLTRVVLATALGQIARWNAAGLDLSVAVNLSARNLLDTEIIGDVHQLLQANRVDANRLTLELTESTVMSDVARSMTVLEDLAAMGVRLSIDDFGTGHSSLARLRRMPVDEVKIDKSFVLSMIHDADDAVIVRSTIDLARNLGLSVVAEGVEDDTTWARLVLLGCHSAQGYVLSRPLPAGQFQEWLVTRERLRMLAPPAGAEVVRAN